MKGNISRVTISDIPKVAPLFDAYRVFYKQPSDMALASTFIETRLKRNESVIFLALEDDIPAGFTQLYYTFSSVSAESFLILNDLYVEPDFRGSGIGKNLLQKAQSFCEANGFKGLALETANENPAQKLYERLGWKKDTEFLHYFWTSPK